MSAAANKHSIQTDPNLDLILDRTVDVPLELVWKAWTEPEHLKVWFCPRPWTVSHCEIDLRPGGNFRTVMRSPEGQDFPNAGCYLEVVPNERLVWTSALLAGYRPAPTADFPSITVFITLEPAGKGTRYVATVLHRDEAARIQHEGMGFFEGWGTALDQLVEHAKSM